jgi:predicted SnoaL-like aldol condensation-catalyzing enzyme
MADPQMNKQTVLAHCNLAFNGRRPAEAVEKYGGSHYIQHNPQAPDGFEAFIQLVTDVDEKADPPRSTLCEGLQVIYELQRALNGRRIGPWTMVAKERPR